jgi:hypothetical protein
MQLFAIDASHSYKKVADVTNYIKLIDLEERKGYEAEPT